MSQFILSDPNFSDGTNKDVIEAIVGEFRDKPGVKLIGYEPDPDFDRLPVEVLGRPEAVREALLNAAARAYELIDMEKQHGHHPRIGAVDTIEIYPAKGITIEECKAFAEDLGNELFKRHGVPIYFTGKNARRPDREDESRHSEPGPFSGAASPPNTQRSGYVMRTSLRLAW